MMIIGTFKIEGIGYASSVAICQYNFLIHFVELIFVGVYAYTLQALYDSNVISLTSCVFQTD